MLDWTPGAGGRVVDEVWMLKMEALKGLQRCSGTAEPMRESEQESGRRLLSEHYSGCRWLEEGGWH